MSRINIPVDPKLHQTMRLHCIERDLTLEEFVNSALKDRNDGGTDE